MNDVLGVIEQEAQLNAKVYVSGTRGYSNYEIAVKNGFEGTEAEWLEKIVEDEADIVWNNIQEKIEEGSLTFTLEESYDSVNESLVLDIIPIDGGQ